MPLSTLRYLLGLAGVFLRFRLHHLIPTQHIPSRMTRGLLAVLRLVSAISTRAPFALSAIPSSNVCDTSTPAETEMSTSERRRRLLSTSLVEGWWEGPGLVGSPQILGPPRARPRAWAPTRWSPVEGVDRSLGPAGAQCSPKQ